MIKIAIFDYDGTLTIEEKGGSTWRDVWEAIDKLELDKDLFNKFYSGKISLDEWIEEILTAFKDSKVSKDLISELAKQQKLLSNVDKMFQKLHEMGIKIYIHSAGIINMVCLNLKDVLQYIQPIYGYIFLFDSNGVISEITKPDYIVDDKSFYVHQIIESEKVDKSEVIYFGNSTYDESVSSTGVRTACVNSDGAHHEDKNIWQSAVFTTDALDLLKCIENK